MDEERARILKLLEDGKITAQEAEKLLVALKGQPRVDMSRDELRARMRRFGLREMRHMPTIVGEAVSSALEDGLNAAVRKQRFEFEGRGRLLVRNVSGDITIQSWDKPTVLFERKEGGLWKANEREGMIMAKVLSGDLKVKVPRSTELTVNSVSGSIVIEGTTRKVDARSVSGDVELCATSGALDVRTTSGDIKMREVEGKCHVVTLSGDIDLGFRNSLGGLVETRSGDAQVWVPMDADVLLEAEVVIDGRIDNRVSTACEVIESRDKNLKLGFGSKANRLWVRCREGTIIVNSYDSSEHKKEEPQGRAGQEN